MPSVRVQNVFYPTGDVITDDAPIEWSYYPLPYLEVSQRRMW